MLAKSIHSSEILINIYPMQPFGVVQDMSCVTFLLLLIYISYEYKEKDILILGTPLKLFLYKYGKWVHVALQQFLKQ